MSMKSTLQERDRVLPAAHRFKERVEQQAGRREGASAQPLLLLLFAVGMLLVLGVFAAMTYSIGARGF